MTFHRPAVAFAAAALLAACATTGSQSTSNGLVSVKSPYTQAETVSRLEAQVRQRNLAVVAKVDHAAAAQRIGQTLRPTEVMIFGNPQAGTPLMQCAQTVGIDLPVKALVWTDTGGQVWVGYNDPVWMVQRHGAAECAAAANVSKALAGIAAATVAK